MGNQFDFIQSIFNMPNVIKDFDEIEDRLDRLGAFIKNSGNGDQLKGRISSLKEMKAVVDENVKAADIMTAHYKSVQDQVDKTVETIKSAVITNVNLNTSWKDGSKSIDDLMKVQIRYKTELSSIRDAQRDLAKQVKDGQITYDQFSSSTLQAMKYQQQLEGGISDVTKQIKLQSTVIAEQAKVIEMNTAAKVEMAAVPSGNIPLTPAGKAPLSSAETAVPYMATKPIEQGTVDVEGELAAVAAQKELAVSATQASAAMIVEETELQRNIKAVVMLELEMSGLVKEQKALTASFEAGEVTEEMYISQMTVLKEQMGFASKEISNFNQTINRQQKEAIAAVGSTDALSQKLALLRAEYNGLSGAAKQSALGKSLQSEIKILDESVKTADAEVGLFTRNVGSYFQEGSKALRPFTGLIRQIGLFLPGFGAIGIMTFLLEPLINLGKALFEDDKLTKQLAKDFEDLAKSASSFAGNEAAKVTTLFDALNSQSLDSKEKVAALKDLVTINEKYFGGLKEENGIVVGLNEAYDKYIANLMKIAESKAIENQLQKLFDQKLDLQLKIDPTFISAATPEVQKQIGSLKAQLAKIPDVDIDSRKNILDLDEKQNKQLQQRQNIMEQIALLEKGSQTVLLPANSAKNNNEQINTLNLRIKGLMDLQTKMSDFDIKTSQKKDPVNRQAIKDLEDFRNAFQKVGEEIQKFDDKSLGIDTTALAKELNGALEEYNSLFFKLKDLRYKDLADVRQALKDGTISTQKANEQNALIEKLFDDNKAKAQKALLDNQSAIREKFFNDEQKKQEKRDQDSLNAGQKQVNGLTSALQKSAVQQLLDKLAGDQIKGGKNPSAKDQKKVLDDQEAIEDQAAIKEFNDKQISAVQLEEKLLEIHRKYAQKKADVDVSEIEKIKAWVNKGEEIVGGIIKASTTAKLNSIQSQEDAFNRMQAQQTKQIEQSTLSETQKAATIALLQNEASIQEKQFAKQRRDANIEEAEFNKAKAITDIILNTAVNVAKVLATPWLAVTVGALGAVELAIAVAQPIPHYAIGTDHAKEGWALTDELGAELYIDKSGKMSMGSSQGANMKWMEEGTKVVAANKKDQWIDDMIYKALFAKEGIRMKEDNELIQKIDGLGRIMEWSTNQLKDAYGKKSKQTNNVNVNVGKDLKTIKMLYEQVYK